MAKSKKNKRLLTIKAQLKAARHAAWKKYHAQHEGPQKAAVVESKKRYKRPQGRQRYNTEE